MSGWKEKRDQATFDGRQTRHEEERRGADTRAAQHPHRIVSATISSRVCRTPKLDATVRSLASAFKTGDKVPCLRPARCNGGRVSSSP